MIDWVQGCWLTSVCGRGKISCTVNQGTGNSVVDHMTIFHCGVSYGGPKHVFDG